MPGHSARGPAGPLRPLPVASLGLAFDPWMVNEDTHLPDCRENLINTVQHLCGPACHQPRHVTSSKGPELRNSPRESLSAGSFAGRPAVSSEAQAPQHTEVGGGGRRSVPPLLSCLSRSPYCHQHRQELRAQIPPPQPAPGCRAAPSSLPPLSSPLPGHLGLQVGLNVPSSHKGNRRRAGQLPPVTTWAAL